MGHTDVTLRAATGADGPAIGAIKVEAGGGPTAGSCRRRCSTVLTSPSRVADWGAYARDMPTDTG